MNRVLETPYLSASGRIVAIQNVAQSGKHSDEEYKNLCIGFKTFAKIAAQFDGAKPYQDFLVATVVDVKSMDNYELYDHNGVAVSDLFGMRQEDTRMMLDVPAQGEANSILTERHNGKTNRKEWALVTKKKGGKHRVLRWFGPSKPSDEVVKKAENSIQYWKSHSALSTEAHQEVMDQLEAAGVDVNNAIKAVNASLKHADDLESPQENDLYSARKSLSQGKKLIQGTVDALTSKGYQNYEESAASVEKSKDWHESNESGGWWYGYEDDSFDNDACPRPSVIPYDDDVIHYYHVGDNHPTGEVSIEGIQEWEPELSDEEAKEAAIEYAKELALEGGEGDDDDCKTDNEADKEKYDEMLKGDPNRMGSALGKIVNQIKQEVEKLWKSK